ncbi:hypothetical protein BMS3Abin07_00468 [bacterium BMS3Abin07]|nr:hypothetical protein BMS3Abin07_00468 [bacterium BMS3Abin07]GBE31953.1 hypothetical protein BMS3Bbin05_00858 [bacterium BMS3Bbin05]
MKRDILKKIYFNGGDDRDLDGFVEKFLPDGLLWIYIALNSEKPWEDVSGRLEKKKKALFVQEYNKAFLFSRSYRELARLFLGREIILHNLFLPHRAEAEPELFMRFERADDLRWKEVLELMS